MSPSLSLSVVLFSFLSLSPSPSPALRRPLEFPPPYALPPLLCLPRLASAFQPPTREIKMAAVVSFPFPFLCRPQLRKTSAAVLQRTASIALWEDWCLCGLRPLCFSGCVRFSLPSFPSDRLAHRLRCLTSFPHKQTHTRNTHNTHNTHKHTQCPAVPQPHALCFRLAPPHRTLAWSTP